jgi:hypothetical protein
MEPSGIDLKALGPFLQGRRVEQTENPRWVTETRSEPDEFAQSLPQQRPVNHREPILWNDPAMCR